MKYFPYYSIRQVEIPLLGFSPRVKRRLMLVFIYMPGQSIGVGGLEIDRVFY